MQMNSNEIRSRRAILSASYFYRIMKLLYYALLLCSSLTKCSYVRSHLRIGQRKMPPKKSSFLREARRDRCDRMIRGRRTRVTVVFVVRLHRGHLKISANNLIFFLSPRFLTSLAIYSYSSFFFLYASHFDAHVSNLILFPKEFSRLYCAFIY